jgi:hypothetical protein
MEHRRRPSPISMRSEGPRTDAERAIVRNDRARQNNPMPNTPAKPERAGEKIFEHIPTQAKLCLYLLKTKRGELCDSLTKYNERKELNPNYPWAVERVLTEDLIGELAKGAQANADRVNELRSFIFAASCQATDSPDEEKLLAAVPSLLKTVPSLHAVLAEAQETHGDKRYEKIEEADPRELATLEAQMKLIAQAIKDRPCGEDGEPAVRAIEAFTNQTAHEIMVLERQKNASKNPRHAVLRERMDRWRPIRNYLYYFRAYKRWCEISHGK